MLNICSDLEPDPSERMAEFFKMGTNHADQDEADVEPALSWDALIFKFSPTQRRALYDYSAKVADCRGLSKLGGCH